MHSRRRLYDIGVPVQLRILPDAHTHTRAALFSFSFHANGRKEYIMESRSVQPRACIVPIAYRCRRRQCCALFLRERHPLTHKPRHTSICVMRTEMHFSSRPVDNLIQSNDDDDWVADKTQTQRKHIYHYMNDKWCHRVIAHTFSVFENGFTDGALHATK